MATGAVVTATYKTINAILEANEITWQDLFIRHQDQEWRERQKLQQRVKELEDQVFHFTDGIKPNPNIKGMTDHDLDKLAGTGE